MNQIIWLLAVGALSTIGVHGRIDDNGMSLTEVCTQGDGRQRFLNMVLESLESFLVKNEPFHMEDDVRQVFRLNNGQLYNLKNAWLRHDPQVACMDEKAHLVFVLSFNDTKVHYTWNLAGIRQVTGGFWTLADRITAEIQLSAPLNHNKKVPFTVDEVRLTELHNMRVQVDGVQPFAWIGTQIGNLGTMINRETLKKFLQNNLRMIFTEVFNEYEV